MTIDPKSVPAAIATCPGLPIDRGGPVFAAPWQAQIFAVVVALHERSLFPWTEFQSRLIAAINDAPVAEQGAEFYYRHWLKAAEELLHRLGLIDAGELTARAKEVAAAAHHHHA